MIHNVAILGADGKLGSVVYKALVENGFNVTVLKRASSKSQTTYPQTTVISDEFPIDECAKALRGQDALVVTIKGTQSELQKRLADAAVLAGVKRMIPADFGSCDSASPLTQEMVPLYINKTEVREYLTELSKKHESFSWTSLVCGHFFDWSLHFLHLWPKERRAEILDGGEAKWSTTTLGQTAEATCRVLQKPDVAKNKMIYIQSFRVSQKEVIKAYERVTGEKWEVSEFSSKAYMTDEKQKADAGDAEASENLVWVLGTVDADWQERGDAFVMTALGLSDQDLDTETRKAVEAELGTKKE